MNKIVRGILAFVAIIASMLVAWVFYSSHKQGLKVPDAKVVSMDPQLLVGEHPVYKGDANSPVTLVEFADYQCPACEFSWTQVSNTLNRYPHGLKLLFHNFPLNIHPLAFSAATAAEAARFQGQFWPMHDTLMRSKGHLTEMDIQHDMEYLKLDPKRFRQDRKKSGDPSVRLDLALSKRLELSSTPTFFLIMSSGKVYKLGSLNQLETIVDRGT